jgi:Kef-type K+ transport system membrane component KefB
MSIFQDQNLIKIVVAGLAILILWWGFRWVFGWAKRLSKLGCLALLVLVIVAAVATRLA